MEISEKHALIRFRLSSILVVEMISLKLMFVILLLLMVHCFSYGQEVPGNLDKDKSPDYDIYDAIADNNEKIENNPLSEGDMMLTPAQHYQLLMGADVQGDLIKRTSNLWKNYKVVRNGKTLYEIPYEYQELFDAYGRRIVGEAIEHYNDNTNIRFRERKASDNDYIRFIHDRGCYSYVGRQGGKQDISLQNSGCLYKGIAIHEMMHAIGYYHEQSRPDRDEYIKVIFDNIEERFKSNFEKRDTDNQGTKYDYKSIMHYGPKSFSKNGQDTITNIKNNGITIGQRDGLSKTDIQSINEVYSEDEEGGGGGGEKPIITETNNDKWCADVQSLGLCKHCALVGDFCAKQCIDFRKSCPEWSESFCKGTYEKFMTTECSASCKDFCLKS